MSGGVLCFYTAMLLGNDTFDIGKYFSFKLPIFRKIITMMIVMGAIYGAVRMVGAIGLWQKKIKCGDWCFL